MQMRLNVIRIWVKHTSYVVTMYFTLAQFFGTVPLITNYSIW